MKMDRRTPLVIQHIFKKSQYFEHATDPQEQRNTGTSSAGVAMEGGTHLYSALVSVK